MQMISKTEPYGKLTLEILSRTTSYQQKASVHLFDILLMK